MSTKTVATRELQNATEDACTRDFCELHPYVELYDWTLGGDRVQAYYIPGEGDGPRWHIAMNRITVDGVETRNAGGYGFYIFNFRQDHYPSCRPDENGLCSCTPSEYRPLTYRAGEICEKCWLQGRGEIYSDDIRGVGKNGCSHN